MNNYNNYQNRSYVPREPDFPPREPQVFNPSEEQGVNFRANTEQSQPVNFNENVRQIPTEPTQQEYADNQNSDKAMGDYYAPVYQSEASSKSIPTPPQPPVFEQNIGYNQPPHVPHPPQAPQMPQHPPMQGGMYQNQVYRRPDGRVYQNGYGNPNFDPRFPHTAKINEEQNPYTYSPEPKQKDKKGNRGLKAFLICLSVVFAICVIGFVVLVSYTLGQNAASKNNTDSTQKPSYSDTIPIEATEPAVEHPESDYSDKIDPNYKGLALNGPVKDKTSTKYTSEYAYNAVSKSVVGVVCYTDEVTDASESSSQGTGIVISTDGYIITNAHIINNSKTAFAIQIVTSDNKTYNAGVVALDTRTDIAVLKADATGLQPATFGKSKDMQIGSTVIAVGNPGGIGYQNSLTMGIISAFDRTVPSSTSVKYIQTDAAINPGNSGGPLCNLYGQIIGMNTSKIVSEHYEGMGFAIPSEKIKEIVDQLIKQGNVSGRVKMGVIGIAVTSAEMEYYNVPAGIWVESVDENGPLKDSDIHSNDIITKVAGQPVTNFGEVFTVLEQYKAGDEITIEVYCTETKKTFEEKLILAEDK